jgi:hypothetical protein
MKRTPMDRGTSQLARTSMSRSNLKIAKLRNLAISPEKKRKRPKKRPGHNEKAMVAARQAARCYLLMPGVLCDASMRAGKMDPCHRNENKGMGLKTGDIFTVPGCRACHDHYDAGNKHTLKEKREAWNAAYRAWGPVRERLHGIVYEPIVGGA